jgi:phospholipid/cholesterol/gamma-HCH transport system substrate-binding protein
MNRSKNVLVGLFVILGLALGGMVIFLIGDERRLFSSTGSFHTSFADVAGLKGGAPVRMGGIDVGHVDKVGYSKKDGMDTTIYVDIKVVESELGRVRKDTKAKISTKGLLGDKMIELTVGKDPDVMPPGSTIETFVDKDIMSRANEVAEKATAVMENVSRATESLANEDLHHDIRATVKNLNDITNEVANGKGYPNRLLTNPEEAERISRAITSLENTSNELSATLRDVRAIVARVEQGPGFAHDLVYGTGPQKQIEQFGHAAEEVALTLEGVRKGDGLAHDILYGGTSDSAQAMANVTAITGDLRAIIGDMRAGKGTIGGLLVDPSIYEDVKTVLGNVQRNDVLRALVRYSIHQDETKPKVDVAKPAATNNAK